MNTGKNSVCSSPYLPAPAVIERTARISGMERLLVLRPRDASMLSYAPGQFFMVGLPGWGEAPISVTSPTGRGDSFELCVRAAGNLTNAIHRLKKGETLWIRGPFGRGFDLNSLKGRDLLFVAGGIGIVPMRSLVKSVVGSKDFGSLTLVYGAKTPEDLIFQDEIEGWRASGVDTRLTVDNGNSGWKGHVGVVTTLIPDIAVRAERTTAAVIGPPVMYKYVITMLEKKGLGPDDILVSLERRMKCGLGKCGHCQINSQYVCQEGPVMRLSELAGMPEAF